MLIGTMSRLGHQLTSRHYMRRHRCRLKCTEALPRGETVGGGEGRRVLPLWPGGRIREEGTEIAGKEGRKKGRKGGREEG